MHLGIQYSTWSAILNSAVFVKCRSSGCSMRKENKLCTVYILYEADKDPS